MLYRRRGEQALTSLPLAGILTAEPVITILQRGDVEICRIQRIAGRLLAVPVGWVFERCSVRRSARFLELPLVDQQGPIASLSGEAVAQIGRAVTVALILIFDERGLERRRCAVTTIELAWCSMLLLGRGQDLFGRCIEIARCRGGSRRVWSCNMLKSSLDRITSGRVIIEVSCSISAPEPGDYTLECLVCDEKYDK
jgi:hypothetical protein